MLPLSILAKFNHRKCFVDILLQAFLHLLRSNIPSISLTRTNRSKLDTCLLYGKRFDVPSSPHQCDGGPQRIIKNSGNRHLFLKFLFPLMEIDKSLSSALQSISNGTLMPVIAMAPGKSFCCAVVVSATLTASLSLSLCQPSPLPQDPDWHSPYLESSSVMLAWHPH